MASSLVLGFAALLTVGHASAQRLLVRPPAVPVPAGGPPAVPPPPGVPGAPKKEAYDLGSLTLPKDDDLKDRIEAAQDRVKEKAWQKACETAAVAARPAGGRVRPGQPHQPRRQRDHRLRQRRRAAG
ncbi:MAG: hypothetical protein U0736_06890 [Gemmataceae bacterium]